MKDLSISGFTSPALLSGMDESTPILVAFSGGADSSALLRMLCEYAKIHGSKIYAAHVNHLIRGEEADRDEQFCRAVCKSLGVELFVLRKDIPAYAKEIGESVETAARRARYDFFDELMETHSIPQLATAHNANDNLETMIFNITRGCGLTGMCGIPAVRSCKHGTVIRPILGMSRAQILDYCRTRGLEYVTDSTNADTDYTRNKIRAAIIPELISINPSAVENAARLSESLREDSLCLTGMSDWFLEEMNDDASFETEKLLGSPAAIANRALMSLYHAVSDGKSLERVHVEAIMRLCEAAVPHSSIDLPCGIVAVIENQRLHIIKKEDIPKQSDDFCIPLFDGENLISQINAQIIIGNSQKKKNIYKKSILLYLDSAKINGTLVARRRRGGDKIKLHGVNKSVKKLLCDMKIPLDLRYRLPMICNGEECVAIPFVAVADGFSTKDEERALTLEFSLCE